MFISTYNTYITTDTSEKSHKTTANGNKDKPEQFASERYEKKISTPAASKNLPVDYVSNYKFIYNQPEQTKNPDEIKFKKIKDMSLAKTAYEDNSIMFSLVKKPTVTISQLIKPNKEQPQNIQELKEQNLRNTMVNTYIENDKYYQITA
ncbi:hypothetical protein [Sulfurimonas sp.]|uniref:hypothetical protein n=1 Tax=Sulfurimonas sp. TaxID=2022749 RepID=UPI0026211B0D|nr:hypothetical protein [Sulfurimonas sp.]MCW8895931.1 hypothetical protein [Sulfurimonas sp.]MCW9067428.1 hypothetical protein [Sulfurimonas sp.]